MFFFVGGPGSGKNYVIDQAWTPACGILAVDSDAVKPLLPASMGDDLHPTAKRIATEWLRQIIEARASVLVAATGAHYEECYPWFELAHKQAMNTVVVWVKCARDAAWGRNCNRDRVLPREIFDERWDLCEQNIPRLIEHADAVRTVYN